MRTLLVLDWDDTVLPTSAILQATAEPQLPDAYSTGVRRLFEECSDIYGPDSLHVFTSSSDGWVKYSAQRFIPQIYNYIEDTPVLHVPKVHGALGVRQKEPVIISLVTGIYNKMKTEGNHAPSLRVLLCGNTEMDVAPAISIRMLLPQVVVSTCRFVTVPTIEQLIDQHQVFTRMIKYGSMLRTCIDVDLREKTRLIHIPPTIDVPKEWKYERCGTNESSVSTCLSISE